jgi:hypothetical protein
MQRKDNDNKEEPQEKKPSLLARMFSALACSTNVEKVETPQNNQDNKEENSCHTRFSQSDPYSTIDPEEPYDPPSQVNNVLSRGANPNGKIPGQVAEEEPSQSVQIDVYEKSQSSRKGP